MGNWINIIGIAGLLLGHALLTVRDDLDKLALFVSGAGGLVVATGSLLLFSWPIVVLNIAWAGLSWYRLLPATITEWLGRFWPTILILFAGFISYWLISGAIAAPTPSTMAAFLTTTIYLAAYAAFVFKRIHKAMYLALSIIGFALLVPHLVVVSSWAVLCNEAVGAVLALYGLLRLATTKRTALI